MAGNKEINRELLKLAGFESEEEIEAFLPDWLLAAERVGLSDEDVRYAAQEYIPAYWDIQYRGVRKMIGAYLRELVEITKTPDYKKQGKKIIYGILPAIVTTYTAFKYAAGDGAYVSFPDLLMVDVLNGFFHKAAPYLNAAEERGFTYGCRHCPLNKMRVAAFMRGVIAAPDIIWSWGFNCDEGPKTDEMIQCMLDEKWKYVVSRIPHDTYSGHADDDDEERIAYLAEIIRLGMEEISETTGIRPSEEDLKKAIVDANRILFKTGQLAAMVSKADPVPVGGNTLTQMQNALAVPFNLGFQYIEEAVDILTAEMREMIKKGEGVLPKGAPKLGSYFVPFCIPWVDRMFRNNGVATTFSQVLTPSKKQLKASRYKDEPYKAIAEQWMKMPQAQNMGYEVASMVEKVESYRPDGMLMGFFDFDRWLGAHQKMVAKLVEERTGVPHYYIESDFWDDRDYSEEALRTRIESIAQLVKIKKEMS